MRILDIALKDLVQLFRDRLSLLVLAGMPIVFTLFMGFAYRGGNQDTAPQEIRTPLGWVNNDPAGLLSTRLFEMLTAAEGLSIHEMEQPAAEQALRKGDVAGVLIIPAGYSAQWTDATMPLTLLADTNTPGGQSLYQMLRAQVTRLMSAAAIARLSAEALALPGDPGELQRSFITAADAWQQTSSAELVRLERAVAQPHAEWYGDNPYNQASPGILVQFAVFSLVFCAQTLVLERKSQTLQRMLTTSLRPWQIITGHTLAMFAAIFAQAFVLIIFGQIALGVDYARAPFGILLVSAALGLWVAALGLLIGALAKNDSQVVLFSLLAMFIFSALGGTWFPLEASSGAFAMVGKAMPSAWAMSGYQNILIRGLDSASALLPALVLLAYAAGFFLLAAWRLRRFGV
ncbi:MAG: ABC transporter permease [Chloroflexota bacterium]|jgi:ABC-type multidrug transport system permease subunit